MLFLAALACAIAQAPVTNAVTDRGPRQKPALVRPGAAGFSFNDPVFGSRIWRITDRLTRPDKIDRSYRTPSATHQNAWSADSAYFYVVSTDGTVVPFAFDPERGTASRTDALRFYIEPQFSYVDGGILYGSVSGGSLRTIDQYDFSTGEYSRLFDLDTLVSGLQGTYIGGVSSSAGPTERILAFFGGASQDRHRYVVVFDRHAPATRRMLDTATLDFKLHHATIDRSGRYVLLYPTSADLAAPRKAAQVYTWDTVTNVTTPMPLIAARSGGHDAFGYGTAVNQDCCTSSTWDAAQWQIRSLASPLVSRDLIAPVLSPKQVYLADHPTWNNARPDRLVPFVTATYRFGANPVEWRPWDDEILAVQTDVGEGGAEVIRLAHHRSDVRQDDAPERSAFWYMPRPNISRDGRWVLFTSNWEKSLGTDPKAPSGEQARQDVFLLQVNGLNPEEEAPAPEPPLEIATVALPDGKVKRAYSVTLQASRPVTWRVSAGALPPGLTLTPGGQIVGTPRSAGAWYSEITATDSAGSASRVFLVTVRK
jgi:hypothetical protein